MINLGGLAFSQNDFKQGDEWCNPAYAWEIANRLLREKLEKALIMYCRQDRWRDGSHALWAADECPHFSGVTHTARLVCIEKVGK